MVFDTKVNGIRTDTEYAVEHSPWSITPNVLALCFFTLTYLSDGQLLCSIISPVK